MLCWALLTLPLALLRGVCGAPTDSAVGPRKINGGAPPPCSITPSIQSNDFEAGALSPWSTVNGTTSGSNATLISRTLGSGHAAQLSVVGSGGGGGAVSLAQLVPLCKATNYSFTFDYKPVSIGKSCLFYISAQSGYGRFSHNTATAPLAKTGGWQTASLSYPNYLRYGVYIVAEIQCSHANDTAVAQVDNFRVAAVGSLEPEGCPGRQLTLQNGGFETGDLLPWKLSPPIPKRSIVSPGYKSKYALQIAVPQVDYAYSAILQNWVRNETCPTYKYDFTFAVNWGNYSYSPNTQAQGCYLYVAPQHCVQRTGGGPFYYPEAANSGWHIMSYSCLAGNSEGLHTTVDLHCATPSTNHDPPIPSFELLLDSFTATPSSE